MSVARHILGGMSIDPDQMLAGLNDEQRQVATTFGGPVAVLAGAGSGKTRAITHRIAYAVASGRHKANASLAVTFTTRAAGELRARLAKLGLPQVSARTFHSAALRQLRYFWPIVEKTELPEVTSKTIGIVSQACKYMGLGDDLSLLRDLACEISWAKVSNVTAERYPQIAEKLSRKVADLDPEQVATVFKNYEIFKRRRSVIDFDDILLCTVAMLHEHREVAEQVREGYKHFTVDEFQDVSPLQHTLLELWVGDRQDLCVVGDPDQSINAFAGADRGLLTNFKKYYPNAVVLHLSKNYRSTPQILETANGLLAHQKNRVPLVATKDPGRVVELVSNSDESEEASQVVEWLVEKHRNGLDWNQCAILFRINAQSMALETCLNDARVPYTVKDSENFYERPEILRALKLLKNSGVKSPELTGDDAKNQIAEILASLGWKPLAPEGAGMVRARWEALNALRDRATQILDERKCSFRQLVEELLKLASIKQIPTSQAVTLSTMHSAKGLEWPAVAVIGVREGMVPFSMAKTPAQLAEERRLLYVALTRAEESLRISWTGANRKSRFLNNFHSQKQDKNLKKEKMKKTSRTCYVCGRALTGGSQNKLGRHEYCEATFDEEFLEELKEWRKAQADSEKVPAFVVFTDKTLQAIAERKPQSMTELKRISGIGPVKAEKYGEKVLDLVAQN